MLYNPFVTEKDVTGIGLPTVTLVLSTFPLNGFLLLSDALAKHEGI